jgi:hypothetical protein
MRLRNALVYIALGSAAASSAFAETRVWLIGGGHTLADSQGQIEANVRWLEDLLLERGIGVRTYFALGEQPGHDVVYWSPEAAAASADDVRARVFGDYSALGLQYRRHELRALAGSTDKAALTAALRADFGALEPDDELLFVFNGHGGLDRADTRNNSLKLWGDQRMTVADLEALLDAAPRETTTRFVMTQCYSGAFQGLIYDDPIAREGFRGNRCGFMAESALRLAEGCDLAVDQDEFRDYTTYFFAALSGATRSGSALPLVQVDRDGDGAVSYREAHFHALVAGRSADLPRSTSEQFLEDWSPWYLRWDSLHDNPASIYWTLAEEVAARNGWNPSARSLEDVRRVQFAAHADSEARRSSARREIEALRQELQRENVQAPVELRDAGSGAGEAPVSSVWLQTMLAASPRYEELQRLQLSLPRVGREALEHTRTLTQIEKIYRLRHLARLESALHTYGGPRARREYAQLLQCEAAVLQ